jgi:hypothetical protein
MVKIAALCHLVSMGQLQFTVLLPCMQVITYLSGTGTEDLVLNATVTSDLEHAWMLTKEYPAALTFKPSINGTSLANFTLPLTGSENDVAVLLAQVRVWVHVHVKYFCRNPKSPLRSLFQLSGFCE